MPSISPPPGLVKDTLLIVISFLSPCDVIACKFVCKSWNAILKDKKLNIDKYPDVGILRIVLPPHIYRSMKKCIWGLPQSCTTYAIEDQPGMFKHPQKRGAYRQCAHCHDNYFCITPAFIKYAEKMVAKNTVGIVLKHGLTTMPADSYIGIQSDW